MEKPTKRKAFNFLRSYFDVVNELENDKDKVDFLMAIINKQFLGEDPEDLNFLVNLCYSSQKHSVEKSVKGWIIANKMDLEGNPIEGKKNDGVTPPPTPPPTPPLTPPLTPNEGGSVGVPPKEEEEEEKEQEKEKEEEEGEEKGGIDIDVFYNIEKCKEVYLSDKKMIKAVCSNKDNRIKENEVGERLKKFNEFLTEEGKHSKKYSDYCSHFKHWHKKKTKSNAIKKRRQFL